MVGERVRENEKKKKRKTTTLLTWQLAQGASSRTERQREAKRHRFPVSLLVPPIFLACSWLLPFQPNPLYYFYLFSFPNQYTPFFISQRVFPSLPLHFLYRRPQTTPFSVLLCKRRSRTNQKKKRKSVIAVVVLFPVRFISMDRAALTVGPGMDMPIMHDSDRYDLVRDIGSGNFGVARLMQDKQTKELVAVKYIERGDKVVFVSTNQ